MLTFQQIAIDLPVCKVVYEQISLRDCFPMVINELHYEPKKTDGLHGYRTICLSFAVCRTCYLLASKEGREAGKGRLL